MQNFNQMYLTHLIGQDIERIRHEIALLCRRSRVEQALSLRMVEQQTGGAGIVSSDKSVTKIRPKFRYNNLSRQNTHYPTRAGQAAPASPDSVTRPESFGQDTYNAALPDIDVAKMI